MKNIAVYLGSAPGCNEIYKGLAYELGFRLAKAGLTLVYGGAAVGTMEVRESGIPVVREGLSEFIETADFAERKQVMEDRSDACIVMPGSFGTMDELFTYACNRAIDKHSKPILIFNFEGYYDPLKQLLANMQQAGFMKPVMAGAIRFFDTIEEIIAALH